MSLPLDTTQLEDENPWAEEAAEAPNQENSSIGEPNEPSNEINETDDVKQDQDLPPSEPLKKVKSPLRQLLPSPMHKHKQQQQPQAHKQQQQQQRFKHQRSPSKKLSLIDGLSEDLVFGVCVVNFHHLRGPEIEYAKLCEEAAGFDYAKKWPNMPFQALPDGAHSFEETFSYFTLYYDNSDGSCKEQATTLFAISCVRHIKTEDLVQKDDEFTRSSVQKSIVVILRQPVFGQIKEKLSVVTKSFFEQKNFNDLSLIDILYNNLRSLYNTKDSFIDENDFYSGLSLRQLVMEFKKDVLVVLKAMLLEKKIVFFCSNPTKLCTTEFSFISLIPNLINNLLDCSSPQLDNYSKGLKLATSFKSSDRNSVLKFSGLPLQIFGKGGIFSPFAPLQQFDELLKIKHYLVGTSNALILNQKSKMCDVLINLDTFSIEILNNELVGQLSLTSHDKKFMTSIINQVNESWSESYSGFIGSDDNIRWQFEDYLIGFLSCVKYDNFIKNFNGEPPQELMLQTTSQTNNQLKHFNLKFIEAWKMTENYKLFDNSTDDHIFDVFDPKHIQSDESKSIAEKFQQFKIDNSKKFEEYKKSFKIETEPNESSDKQPNKLWNWYTKKSKE